MPKTNKELAVDVICAWLHSASVINEGTKANLPSVEQLNEAINKIHTNLSKLDS